MSQNSLDQSDCRVFKLAIYLEQNDEKDFFPCWYRFIEIKSWLKNIGVGVVTNKWPLWSQDTKIHFISRSDQ